MDIIFEDKSLIVCIKPVGILSQAGTGNEESMITLLEAQYGGKIYPVHRLDKGVGGIMVYAKTAAAAASLSKQVSERIMKKEYIAAVQSVPEKQEGIMEDLLFKDRAKNKTFVVSRQRKGVKKASLSYKVEKTGTYEDNIISAVSVQLHTGRSHQIRVQFASRKHPLLGDSRYGSKISVGNIQLWSSALEFYHPESGEKMNFRVLPPENYIVNQI